MPSVVPLFEAPLRERLPAPLSRAVLQLEFEIATNGAAAAGDELARAIEEAIAYLGRLWVAEYLDGLSRAPALAAPLLNSDVFECLGEDRHTLSGTWLLLSRRVRERFVATGTPTVVEGLLQWAPGPPSDDTGTLGRLRLFRNAFAHGSFLADAAQVLAHRELLHSALAAVRGLVEQPPVFRDAESGAWLEATGAGAPAASPAHRVGDAQPVITGAGERVLHLYPLLSASRRDGVVLAPPPSQRVSEVLRAHPALGVWVARYELERQGQLGYAGPSSAPLPADFAASLEEALRGPGLVLVDAPPGTGGRRLLDEGAFDVSAFTAVSRVLVSPGDASQSGVSVARAVLRLAQRGLGQPEDGRRLHAGNALAADGPLAQALTALGASGRRVLLVLGELHSGLEAYRGEPVTVRDVWGFLAGRPLTAVATAWPASSRRVVFDRRLALPVPAQVPQAEVDAALARLVRTPLHRDALATLVALRRPATLFEVCDALEAGGAPPVFEPAVERALWDLEPVLRWTRDAPSADGSRARLWAPFHAQLAASVESAHPTGGTR